MVALVQNEVEGDGSVAVEDPEDPEDQLEVQGPVWGGIQVHWQVEVQTLLPWVQVGAYLGVRWLAGVGRGKEEVHLEEEDRVGVGKGPVVAICKVQVGADARRGEAGGPVGVPEAWSWRSLWLVTLGRIQVP